MRCLNCFRSLLIACLLVGLCASSASAQKNKGGGATNLPPVKYEVSFLPVAGLSSIFDVNDHGAALCEIEVAAAGVPVATTRDYAPAVVDQTGSVTFLDNAVNSEKDWELSAYGGINNDGSILVSGYIPLEDGDFEFSALLLTPDGNGRYNVLEVGPRTLYYAMQQSVDACAINDAGDLVIYKSFRDGTHAFSVLKAEGGVTDLSHLVLYPEFWGAMNNLGTFLAQAPAGPWFTESIAVHRDGSVTEFAHLADADFPTDSSSSFPRIATDLNDFGVAVGAQPDLQGKGRNARRQARPVIYDTNGSASWLNAPPAYEVGINNQLKNGESVIVGYTVDWSIYYPGETTSSTDLTRDLWLKFPGYGGVYVVDLMDNTNKLAWAALGFHDWNYSAGQEVYLLTPRLADDSVDNAAYPVVMGLVTDRAYTTNAFGIGLFVLRPVPVQ